MGVAAPAWMREIQRDLKDAFGSSRRPGIRFEANDADIPEVPAALAEPTVSSTAESLTTRPSARMAVATSTGEYSRPSPARRSRTKVKR
jgi:hypothetical protein